MKDWLCERLGHPTFVASERGYNCPCGVGWSLDRLQRLRWWWEGVTTFRIEVAEMYPIPAGFGVAYADPTCRVWVCYRWPLNHLVALLRRFWFWARHARIAEWQEQARRQMQQEWRRGYEQGLRDGRQEGQREERERVEGILAFMASKADDGRKA